MTREHAQQLLERIIESLDVSTSLVGREKALALILAALPAMPTMDREVLGKIARRTWINGVGNDKQVWAAVADAVLAEAGIDPRSGSEKAFDAANDASMREEGLDLITPPAEPTDAEVEEREEFVRQHIMIARQDFDGAKRCHAVLMQDKTEANSLSISLRDGETLVSLLDAARRENERLSVVVANREKEIAVLKDAVEQERKNRFENAGDWRAANDKLRADVAAELRRAWEAEAAMGKAWTDALSLITFSQDSKGILRTSPVLHDIDKLGAASLANTANPLTQEVERLRGILAELWGTLCPDGGLEEYAELVAKASRLTARIKELELENDHWKNCYYELEEYNNKKIEELEVEITQLNRKV